MTDTQVEGGYRAAKVRTIPHAACAVAVRGPGFAVNAAARVFGQYTIFDDAARVAGPQLRDAILQEQSAAVAAEIIARAQRGEIMAPQAVPEPSIDGVALGWSPADRRVRIFMFSSDDGYELRETAVVLSPMLEFRDMPEGTLRDGHLDLGRDPIAGMLKIIEAQRSKLSSSDFPIGGHAVLTAIERDQIVQRIVRAWPD
jgi:hypothetical protein